MQCGIEAVRLVNRCIKPKSSIPVAFFHALPVANCASIKCRGAAQVLEVVVGFIAVLYVIGNSDPDTIGIRDAVVMEVTGLSCTTFQFGDPRVWRTPALTEAVKARAMMRIFLAR